jgi:hypothetical protein
MPLYHDAWERVEGIAVGDNLLALSHPTVNFLKWDSSLVFLTLCTLLTVYACAWTFQFVLWKKVNPFDCFPVITLNCSYHMTPSWERVKWTRLHFVLETSIYLKRSGMFPFKVQLFRGCKSETEPINTRSDVQHVIRYQVLLLSCNIFVRSHCRLHYAHINCL